LIRAGRDATISATDNAGKRGVVELSEKDLDKATGGITIMKVSDKASPKLFFETAVAGVNG